MEHGRTIHQGEAGNLGQVDLGQLGVQILQLSSVSGGGDLLDESLSLVIDVLAPVAGPVVGNTHIVLAHKLVHTAPGIGGSGSIGRPHEDGVLSLVGIDKDGLIDGVLGIQSGDLNANVLTGSGNHFHGGLPVSPAVGANSVQGDLLTVPLTPSVAVAVHDTGFVQQSLGAFDVIACPLQIGNGVVIVQSLLTVGGVHQGAGNIGEAGGLIGHGVGDDGIVVNSHGNGLTKGGILSDNGEVHVVPCGRHGQADTIGSFVIEGGDGQAVFQPQILNVADELLANVNLASLQSDFTSGVISVDNVSQVLGNRELTPHGGVLTPVVVVTDQNDLLIVGVVLGVGAGPNDIITGVVQDSGGVAVAALNDLVDPGSLRNGSQFQEVQNLQGVDRRAAGIKLAVDDQALVTGSLDAVDESAVGRTGAVADLNADFPGADNVGGGDRRAVRPVGGFLQIDRKLSHVVVPGVVAVGQQTDQLAGHYVPHVQGLEHGSTVAGTSGEGHGVILVGSDDVPGVDGTPLLTSKVQGLVTRQVGGITGCFGFSRGGGVSSRSGDGDVSDSGSGSVLLGTGGEGQNHRQNQKHGNQFFHCFSSFNFCY